MSRRKPLPANRVASEIEDAVIWNYAKNKFVPNTMHLKNEAKRFAAMDLVYSGKLKLCFKWLEVDR